MQAGTKTEARRFPRIRLEVDVNLDLRKASLIPGRTLDISEFGISPVLPTEMPIGEAVSREIRFPLELARVMAVVRNTKIFRYCFAFDRPDIGRDLIKKVPKQH